jgi:hypothetical protein
MILKQILQKSKPPVTGGCGSCCSTTDERFDKMGGASGVGGKFEQE